MTNLPLIRRLRSASPDLEDGRLLLKLAKSAAQPYRPLMAHLVLTRRCNLTCGYCYEADRESPPVALVDVRARIDHLARLGTIFVTLTGGEPLLHPDLIEIVAYVRKRGMTPVMNSNAFLLTRARILALGEAGLWAMQVSIDNVEPNATTQKSLRPLMPKLRLLAKHATFRVRINTVLGSGDPRQAVEVAKQAIALGFDAKCSLVRDDQGKVIALDAPARRAYDEIRRLGKRAPDYLSEDFQLELIDKGEVDWKCRAGARYFTVCQDGRVHFCESSYNSPGKALANYDESDIRRAFHLRKSCQPTCAVAYAHQASRMDKYRRQDRQPTEIDKTCWMAAETIIAPASLLRKAA